MNNFILFTSDPKYSPTWQILCPQLKIISFCPGNGKISLGDFGSSCGLAEWVRGVIRRFDGRFVERVNEFRETRSQNLCSSLL